MHFNISRYNKTYIISTLSMLWRRTVHPKKYAHGFCFAVLCCGYTLTDFPISIRLTSLALWQSNDRPSASKATLMNMDKYFMWIHYERLHNHNKAKHNNTVCIFLGIYCRDLGLRQPSRRVDIRQASPNIYTNIFPYLQAERYCSTAISTRNNCLVMISWIHIQLLSRGKHVPIVKRYMRVTWHGKYVSKKWYIDMNICVVKKSPVTN